MADFLGGFGAGLSEEWVDSFERSARERAAAAQDLSAGVAGLSVTAEGAGGAVRVTVSGSGAVTDLRLEPEVEGWAASEIAERVLWTMRRAQAQLVDEVRAVAARTVGVDSESGRAVVGGFRDRFPVPEPEAGLPGEAPQVGGVADRYAGVRAARAEQLKGWGRRG